MRTTAIGLALGLGLLIGGFAVWPGQNLAAPHPLPGDGNGDLITQMIPAAENRQLMTVIDPRTQVLSVYHIHVNTGEVELKSVRSLRYDLQIEEFNGTSPLPREIRSMLEHK